MRAERSVSRDRFLVLVRKLAFVSGCAGMPVLACAASNANTPTGGGGASSTTGTTSVAATTATSEPSTDTPCRCSWDVNSAAAPRVCKKGEQNYEGVACVPSQHGEGGYSMPPTPGPLPPPDLPRDA